MNLPQIGNYGVKPRDIALLRGADVILRDEARKALGLDPDTPSDQDFGEQFAASAGSRMEEVKLGDQLASDTNATGYQ